MADPAFGGVYDVGTVDLTADDDEVTSTGALFVDVVEGDLLIAQGLAMVIDSTVDPYDTLTLKRGWPGTTEAAAEYVIVKMSWLRYRPALLAKRVNELLAMLDDLNLFVYVAGDEPDPSLGEDGQQAFKFSDNSWRMWIKTDGIWIPQNTPISTFMQMRYK